MQTPAAIVLTFTMLPEPRPSMAGTSAAGGEAHLLRCGFGDSPFVHQPIFFLGKVGQVIHSGRAKPPNSWRRRAPG